MIECFTDGACRNNQERINRGGNGFLVVENNQVIHQFTEININTTNNREELKGIINALRYCELHKIKSPVIHLDSQYCRSGITEWVHKWIKNYWMTSSREPVKNQDLWRELIELSNRVQPEYRYIKGHQKVKGKVIDNFNNVIDALINETLDKI
jgi:ribonuclease HI